MQSCCSRHPPAPALPPVLFVPPAPPVLFVPAAPPVLFVPAVLPVPAEPPVLLLPAAPPELVEPPESPGPQAVEKAARMVSIEANASLMKGAFQTGQAPSMLAERRRLCAPPLARAPRWGNLPRCSPPP